MTPPSRPALLTSTASALILSSAALAQQEPILLDKLMVTSAAGHEQKITEAPASISVLSQEDLQQRRYGNLAEALDDVEGVDIRQGSGKTGGLDISIRGMPSDYTLILIDGRRQNTAGNVTPNGFNDTATSFMPPMSAIERIEIIRGPMSTLYGSDAIGGVVNIITKKVTDEWAGSASLEHTFQEHRDYGETSKVSFYTSGPLIKDRLGLAVRGSLYDREASDLSFDDGSTVNRRGASPVEGRNYTVGARLTLTPNENHDLALDMERGRQVYNNDDCQLGTLDGYQTGSNVAGCSQPQPTNIAGYSDELRFERDRITLSHTGHLELGTLESSLAYNTTETIGRTIPGTLGVPYRSPYHSIVGGRDRKLESTDLVFDTKLVAPIGESHLATLGGQYWDAKVTDGIATKDFKQSSWAIFIEDEWRLLDSLSFTVGARYEDHDAFGGHVSPRVYLVWNTTDHWTLKGGVSRGYKTPTLNQLHDGISAVSGQGSNFQFGNPDLDPEVSTNTEFGVYYDSQAGFNANITLFHNKFKDKIDSAPDRLNCHWASNPNQPGCVDYGDAFTQESFSHAVNIGKAITEGLELAGRWQFAPAWSVSANYTYTDSEQQSGEDKGARLTNTPRHLLNARLDWSATERLNLWFKGEYRSERKRFLNRYANLTPADQALVDGAGDLDAYEVFHLGGSFKASDNVTLSLAVYNLFDKDFLKGKHYTTDTGTTQWVSRYIQSGRSVDGTIEEGRRLWLSANITF